MDVEYPKLTVADVPEAVPHPDRYRDPRSGASMDDLIAQRELGLAFENIERVDVVPMAVGFDAESRSETPIDYLELRQLRKHAVVPRPPRDSLALARAEEDAGHRASIARDGARMALRSTNTGTLIRPGGDS